MLTHFLSFPTLWTTYATSLDSPNLMSIGDIHNNICIKEGDEWKATFITPLGLFEPMVMFFSLCGSPLTFQAFMNYNFADYIGEGWLVIYMDDLAIGADSLEDEEQKVCLVLQCFHDLGLSLKLTKCEFGKLEIKFLGMIIGSGCIHMDPAKLSAIATWSPLKTVKAIQYFLSFCNFYCKFIPGFSNTVAPLTVTVQGHDICFFCYSLSPVVI